jgi:hypothetical protein
MRNIKNQGRISVSNQSYTELEEEEFTYVGEIRMFHTFNNTISIPRGWMKLNGNVVNQANYDALHGAGAFVQDNIASSVLFNKTLQDATDKYPIGKSTTPLAHTYTGNTNHSVTGFSHTHTARHIHQWYEYRAGSSARSYNSSGSATTNFEPSDPNDGDSEGISFIDFSPADQISKNCYTRRPQTNSAGDEGTTNTGLTNTTRDLQPHSFDIIYMIRVAE